MRARRRARSWRSAPRCFRAGSACPGKVAPGFPRKDMRQRMKLARILIDPIGCALAAAGPSGRGGDPPRSLAARGAVKVERADALAHRHGLLLERLGGGRV